MTPLLSDVSKWASEAFRDGFFDAGELRPAHRRETALGLVYAVIPHGIEAGALRALALSVRDIADRGAGAALSADQANALEALAVERALPRCFSEILREAVPHVRTGADLDALYGVLSGAEEAYEAVRAVLAGLAELPGPPPGASPGRAPK
jgi:hypothetical protein